MILGNQIPTLEVIPTGIKGSIGSEVVDLAEEAGLILDPWQQRLIEYTFSFSKERVRDDKTAYIKNKWAAFEVAINVSRQNGKGSYLEAVELGGLYILEEKLIIHSSHQFDTSNEAFERILMLIESNPSMDQEVRRVSRAHGTEGITLKSGSRLRFRTRTKGGGRGFTCDRLIMDEYMYLEALQTKALIPTLSARPNAQIIYTGSAGDKHSTHQGRIRERAVKADGDRKKLYFAEWAINPHTDMCDIDCDDHDNPYEEKSWAKSNPGYNYRLDRSSIEAEVEALDSDSFNQERLGVGDYPSEDAEWKVIGLDAWMSRMNDLSTWEINKPWVLSVDTTPDLRWSCITAVGFGEDENTIHGEITAEAYGDGHRLDFRPGTQWVVKRVKEIFDKKDTKLKPRAVIIDKRSQAGQFINELEAEGITVLRPDSAEYAQACGELYSDIVPRKGNKAKFVHLGQDPLTAAVKGAVKRDLAEMWIWDKKGSKTIISPLVGVTLGTWGLRFVSKIKESAGPWAIRR